MNLLKLALDWAKPYVAAEVETLKENKATNIATAEAYLNAEELTASQAIAKVIAAPLQRVPIIGGFAVTWVENELKTVLTEGESDLPTLYDQGIAWLEKEETDL